MSPQLAPLATAGNLGPGRDPSTGHTELRVVTLCKRPVTCTQETLPKVLSGTDQSLVSVFELQPLQSLPSGSDRVGALQGYHNLLLLPFPASLQVQHTAASRLVTFTAKGSHSLSRRLVPPAGTLSCGPGSKENQLLISLTNIEENKSK